MKIVEIDISKLTPYIRNAKQHTSEQIQQIVSSINKFGFNDPLGVYGTKNIIVEGHGRYLAAKELGLEKVPCIKLNHLSDEERKAYALTHNQLTMNTGWDEELLKLELADLQSLDMADFGFESNLEPIDELDNIVEDEVPETPTEPTSKKGDIWQLGNHRLICGDCTDESVLTRLMNGVKADIIVTDPPYNVCIENVQKGVQNSRANKAKNKNNRVDKGDYTNVDNDCMPDKDFAIFLDKAFGNMYKNTKVGGVAYVFFSSSESINFFTQFKKYFVNCQQLIWVKHHFSLSHKDYHYRHEPIIYGYIEGDKHYFINSRSEDTVIDDSEIDYKKLTKSEAVGMLKELMQNNSQPTTVIYENKPERSEVHPTMKPIKLIARLMRNSSRKDEIVLDPFGGSGTTLMAAEQLGRKCYMAEIDLKYCDVIIQRYEKFTGTKAVKIKEK